MTENDRENGSSGKRLRNEFRVFFSIFRAYSVKKYPRCGKHRGVWLFFIVCCIFLWEYWWYFVEYKNYRQADHCCHTDSYCSIIMAIYC